MKKSNFYSNIVRLAAFSVLLSCSSIATAFNISLDFSAGGLSASQQNTITQATDFWNTTITGYKTSIQTTGPNGFSGFTIDASTDNLGGVGGTLASASTFAIQNSFSGGYFLTTRGDITFDTFDIGNLETNGTLLDVAKHEIAHIIGFGALWDANGLYVNGSGEYTGAEGLAAYQAEFDSSANFVPVELEGGQGTANGHWNENNNGSGTTGVTDNQGNDMQNELMTGWLNAPTFLSQTTVASFGDLGYTYNVSAIPVPAAVWLFASALGFFGLSTRSRKIK